MQKDSKRRQDEAGEDQYGTLLLHSPFLNHADTLLRRLCLLCLWVLLDLDV